MYRNICTFNMYSRSQFASPPPPTTHSYSLESSSMFQQYSNKRRLLQKYRQYPSLVFNCLLPVSQCDNIILLWNNFIRKITEQYAFKNPQLYIEKITTHQIGKESVFPWFLGVSLILIQAVLQFQCQAVVVSPHHIKNLVTNDKSAIQKNNLRNASTY